MDAEHPCRDRLLLHLLSFYMLLCIRAVVYAGSHPRHLLRIPISGLQTGLLFEPMHSQPPSFSRTC